MRLTLRPGIACDKRFSPVLFGFFQASLVLGPSGWFGLPPIIDGKTLDPSRNKADFSARRSITVVDIGMTKMPTLTILPNDALCPVDALYPVVPLVTGLSR
jgi:hypothetical protein